MPYRQDTKNNHLAPKPETTSKVSRPESSNSLPEPKFDVEIFFKDHCFESEATPEWYSHNRDLKAPPPPPPQTKFYHCMLCDKYCNNCKELIANHLKIYHTPEEIKEFYSQKRPRK